MCYFCNKENCWSTKHSLEERQQTYQLFKQRKQQDQKQPPPLYTHFLARHEGFEDPDAQEPTADDDPYDQYLASLGKEDSSADDEDDDDCLHTTYFTDGTYNGRLAAGILANQATQHALTKEDLYSQAPDVPAIAFILKGRYSSTVLQGILPDSGAAGLSTAGHPQFLTLQRLLPSITIDTAVAGAPVRFGSGSPLWSIGATTIPTPFGSILFHDIQANTPFLLCLAGMDTQKCRGGEILNCIATKEFVEIRVAPSKVTDASY